ncbi:flavin reductase [Bradyrhizobium forestalis]|uniref:Flavin reductase n=1 Tax=Bradyrhizobium forestalis TaxID=1419263 RepID=A0A2M8QXQ3_9BRAD|nr:flavin reductase [Bradyrhizobium forestalis]
MNPSIDPLHFRRMLGYYASGITVVCGLDSGEPLGFTCQSFHSVSLNPPLVSLSIMSTSKTWPRIRATGCFSVNILLEEQRDISDKFAKSGGDRWAGVRWEATGAGNPKILGLIVCLDCVHHAEYEAGDHIIAIGNVLDTCGPDQFFNRRTPLLFYQGPYHRIVEDT